MNRVDELEKENFDLRQLLEIGKSLNSTLEYNRLIDSILHICMGQMRVLEAGLFVRREADDAELVLHRDYIGFELDHTSAYEIPQDTRLREFLVNNPGCYTADELIIHCEVPKGLESIPFSLIVPLIARSDLQGIIVLGRRIDDEAFSAEERAYVLDIGMLAAIAVYNAYLFDRATIDSLTRLKRRHVLEERMLEVFRTVRKPQERHSLLMLDVDHFKPVNDTYGHGFGDEVLRRIAETLQSHTRPGDLAARYGGEEFAVLLPHTPIEMACGIAERIRAAVETLNFQNGETQIRVTISIGVAEYDSAQDHLPQDLFGRADKALYQAKTEGRNRIVRA